MNDPLAAYLHDHLAGSHFALKLLDTMQDQFSHEPLGAFAAAISAEIRPDQDTLEQIVERVGKSSLDMTEAAGWVAEKASQLKLRRETPAGGLGSFEALETLALGIQGKARLWQALSHIREVDQRVPEYDYGELIRRAEQQFAMVEQERLRQIPATFSQKH